MIDCSPSRRRTIPSIVGVCAAYAFFVWLPCRAEAQAAADTVSVPRTSKTPVARQTTVIAGDTHLSVTRQGALPVLVVIETNAGTFEVAGDSAAFAEWVDSSDALPEPSLLKKNHFKWKSFRVRGQTDTMTSMQFTRVGTAAKPEIELTVSNGAWGTFEFLGPQRSEVFAALRGIGVDTTDTAHVRTRWLTERRTCAAPMNGDSARVRTDTNCVRPRIEKQAAGMSTNPHPSYPQSMLYRGKPGDVTIQFVIDSTGIIDHRTVRLLESSHPDFAHAVLDVLPQFRFTPAEVDGRPVKELVELPFSFAIRSR